MASGCGAQDPPQEPQEGDLRLVPTFRLPNGTDVCDEYHAGAVQLYRNGNWSAICPRSFAGNEEEFTLDAQVICRQLGFPFGSVMGLTVADIAAENRADNIVATRVREPARRSTSVLF